MMDTERTSRDEYSAVARGLARKVVELRAILRHQGDVISDMHEERDRARHAHHSRFRSSKMAWRLDSWAYVLGVTSSGGVTWNGHCNGCVSVRFRGKRVYVLGRQVDWWSCLIRYWHVRREIPSTSICTVCMPCWVCSSTDRMHDAWLCEKTRQEMRQVAS